MKRQQIKRTDKKNWENPKLTKYEPPVYEDKGESGHGSS